MAEILPPVHRSRAMPDPASLWEDEAPGLAAVARLALTAARGKMTGQFLGLSVRRIDIAVDRLVANPRPTACKLQPTGDLLGRPAFLEAVEHGRAQAWMPDQLALPGAPRRRKLLGRHMPVARGHRHLGIMPEVAPDLAMDGRAVPAKLRRDLRDADLLVQKPGQDAPLVEGEVGCQGPVLHVENASQHRAVAFQNGIRRYPRCDFNSQRYVSLI